VDDTAEVACVGRSAGSHARRGKLFQIRRKDSPTTGEAKSKEKEARSKFLPSEKRAALALLHPHFLKDFLAKMTIHHSA
jgi:hypothetical protein